MSNAVHSSTSSVVTEGTFKNTESGSVVNGNWVVNRNAMTGAKLYSTGIQVTTEQTDRKFPLIIKADKLAKVQQGYANAQPARTLLLADNTDYRLVSEPTSLEANDELGLPAIQQARYKPIVQSKPVQFG